MKTGPQEPPRFKKVKLDVLIALIALIVIIAGAAIYTTNHKADDQSAQSAAPGWTHYANQKYSFQFDYPGSWGKPGVTQDKGESGSHYTVAFTNTKAPNKRSLFVSFTMDSDDYKRKACQNGQCSIISNAVTSKTIQMDLGTRSNTFINHDGSSYGFITNGGTGTTLQEQQIISLPAAKVSAAVATFTISNAIGCPSNKFASPSQLLCINLNDYTTVNKFLKSIKST